MFEKIRELFLQHVRWIIRFIAKNIFNEDLNNLS